MLGDQFGGFTPGRVLLIDGDGPAYVAASTVKTLPTAIKRFQSLVLEQMFLANAESAEVHLTASGSLKAGRFNIRATKPYQGNRDNKAKPSLLEPLRDAMAHPSNWLPEFEVFNHRILEADDAMIIAAYRLGKLGVIRSDDKDLRMTPGPYFEIDSNKIIEAGDFGHLIEKYTPSGQFKCLGYGKKFFWAQMLMGDTADNIAGLTKLDGKLCGPRCAYDLLSGMNSESAVANAVLAAYRRNSQNPLPEGYLLWLLRTEQDSFWTYLTELWPTLTHENQLHLAHSVRRTDWFVTPEVKDEDDE